MGLLQRLASAVARPEPALLRGVERTERPPAERFQAALEAAIVLFRETEDLHPYWDYRLEKVDEQRVRVVMYTGDARAEWEKHEVVCLTEELPLAFARCLVCVMDDPATAEHRRRYDELRAREAA